MNNKMLFTIALVFALMGIIGCSDSSAPITTPEIILNLETFVEGSGEETYIRAESTVVNSGSITVHYPLNCGIPGAISVKDDAGVSLVLRDPELIPLCPPVFLSLEAGDSYGGGVDLVRAWDANGEEYQIPPGRYTVRTTFTYYVGGNDEPVRMESEITTDIE